jgi:hypothetical protein
VNILVDGETRKYSFDPIGTGPNAIMDPATGSVLSMAQYRAIIASDALKRRYAELGREQGATEAVQELLDTGRFIDTDRTWGGKPGFPESELNVPSVVSGMKGRWITDDEGNQKYFEGTEQWRGQSFDWNRGSGAAQWRAMAAYSRRAKVDYMVNHGIITESERVDFERPYSLAGGQMWEQINGISRDLQVDQYVAMNELGVEVNRIRAESVSRGGGRIAPKYSVPAELRTIPNYKALAVETKGLFQNQLGRDMEDWELSFLADSLKEEYSTRNDQLIQAHRSAWEDAVSGGTVNVDDIEVTDPASELTFDIEQRYADELARQEDVEEYGSNRQLLMDSIAVGQRMI